MRPGILITRVNPAAERLFGCTAEDLLGERMTDYLTESSAAQLEAFCNEPCGRPKSPHQWWIPRDDIGQVAATDATVLVLGETGTGKELVARSIHGLSLRADKPLVLVNCAAIPATLIESEFFGHEKGAFTGAVQRREGRFAMADGGTIFLDEIGELPIKLQARLLRVVQEGEFEPLGGNRTLKVGVRVVAATHRDLRQRVADGLFREDLFFRLNVFPITIPPLRQRGRDIELLAAAFTQRFARRLGKQIDPPCPRASSRWTSAAKLETAPGP